MENTASKTLDSKSISQALKVANNVMDKWNCSPQQKIALLGLKKSAMYQKIKAAIDGKPVTLDSDQLERVSYILNIHQSLRMIFSNPENVYSFVNMANYNSFFNGKTPMEIMSSGSFASLYESYRRIDSMRSGGW